MGFTRVALDPPHSSEFQGSRTLGSQAPPGAAPAVSAEPCPVHSSPPAPRGQLSPWLASVGAEAQPFCRQSRSEMQAVGPSPHSAGPTSALLGWRCSNLCSEKRADMSGHAQVRGTRGRGIAEVTPGCPGLPPARSIYTGPDQPQRPGWPLSIPVNRQWGHPEPRGTHVSTMPSPRASHTLGGHGWAVRSPKCPSRIRHPTWQWG